MSASHRKSPRFVPCLTMLVACVMQVSDGQAATWWWNTATSGTWTNASLWSNAATGGSTGAGPTNDTTTDVVVFNQTGINGPVTALLSQDQSIRGITGTNTGVTTIQSSTTTPRILTLGSSGITLGAGAGAFTIGATGSAVNVAISGNQSWTNNSSSMFTVNGGVSSSATTGTQTLTIGGAGNTTMAGSITNGSGTVALTKSGGGTLTLTATNGYTGATAVNGGALVFAGGMTGTMTQITVTTATMAIQSGSYATSTTFAISNGAVNQTGGFVRPGGQQIIVANAGSSTGLYTLSGGTIAAFASTTRGIMLGQSANSSGTFSMSGGLIDMTTGGAATLMMGRHDSGNSGVSSTFIQTGGVARIGNLSIGGSGTSGAGGTQALTLTGGTFTAVAFPRLSAGNSNVATITIGGSADVTLPAFPTVSGTSATATLYFNGGVLRPAAASAAYMGGLTNAYVQAGGGTFNVAGGNDITISQALLADGTSAGGGLTKQGVGTLTLSGSNTYTGATTISAGVLALGENGSFASSNVIKVGDAGSSNAILDLTAKTAAFAVGAGQTLAGGGTVLVAQGQQFQVQGTFAPGNSPGLFTFDGGTTVLSGATVMEIFGTSRATAPSHGSGFYDAVDIVDNGTLQFGGSLTLEFSGLFDDNAMFALFTPASGSTLAGNFTSVGVTGGFYSGLSWSESGGVWKSSNTEGGQSLEFSSITGQLVVVPEPGAIVLAGLGVALAAWAARRR